MAVKNINDADFRKHTQQGLVLVDFWAEWCGPCKMLSPIIEELAGEREDISFAKLNIDDNQNTAQEAGVTAIPTLILYKEGKAVDRITGVVPKAKLQSFLDKHLN